MGRISTRSWSMAAGIWSHTVEARRGPSFMFYGVCMFFQPPIVHVSHSNITCSKDYRAEQKTIICTWLENEEKTTWVMSWKCVIDFFKLCACKLFIIGFNESNTLGISLNCKIRLYNEKLSPFMQLQSQKPSGLLSERNAVCSPHITVVLCT